MAALKEEPHTPFERDLIVSTEIPHYVCPTDPTKLLTNWVPNHLLLLEKLKNTYFVVRHGESEANIARIIASECHNFGDEVFGLGAKLGLTEIGKDQVKIRAMEFASHLQIPNKDIILIHSDLLRTIQTAQIWSQVLALSPEQVIPHKNLRERLYGTAEGETEDLLGEIYTQDEALAWKSFNRAEPIAQAVHRLTELVLQLETGLVGKTIILITHSSPAKALEAAFTCDFEAFHTGIKKYGNGEFRKMRLREK